MTPPSTDIAAGETLADANRLAASLLAEAERQAEDIVARAHEAASWMLGHARRAVDEMFRWPSEEFLGVLMDSHAAIRALVAEAAVDLREVGPGPGVEPPASAVRRQAIGSPA